MTFTDRPENERVAYCQNCGKALSAEEVRNVGPAVYCDPCLVAKVASAERSGAGPGTGSSGSYGFSGTSSGVNYNFEGSMAPPPPPAGSPNPGLAALLGFIPGVGAFYNGQYAKGVVHLVVFAVLTSLADHNGIFGMFVAGWVFYQVIEAHHTARARRDGTPLPNPFGLNDIGERLGFGRAWPGGPHAPGQPPPPSGPAATADPAAAGSYVPPATAYAPPVAGYSAYAPPPPSWGAPAESYAPVPPPLAPDHFPHAGFGGSRVPTGAIVLIGLGVIFLVANSGLFRGFPVHRLIPFLLIGIGVWVFVRKMTETGGGLADDGTAAYRLRLFRAARGAVWIVLVGVLFLLDSFGILSWGRSWPLFIILGGVMAFFERTTYTAAMPVQYGYGPPVAPVDPVPSTPPPSSSAIVPTSTHDREGN